jgi:hypothetical protein
VALRPVLGRRVCPRDRVRFSDLGVRLRGGLGIRELDSAGGALTVLGALHPLAGLGSRAVSFRVCTLSVSLAFC